MLGFYNALVTRRSQVRFLSPAPESSFQKSMTVYETPRKARLARALLFLSVSF